MHARFAWPSRRLLIVALLLTLPCFSYMASTAVGQEKSNRLELEDPAEPLVERQPRGEAENDRIEALALFSAGRAHQQREEYAKALRYYQRALRCDPQAVSLARLIIPLAFRLDQRAVAVRYALKTVEMEEADPLLLRNLGVFLSKQGDWAGAATLYEKALAAIGNDAIPKDVTDVLLKMEMGRIHHLLGQYDKAAKCFDVVLLALNKPKQFAVDDEVRKVLLGDAAMTYALFGECFLLADRAEDAAAMFDKSQKIKPRKARGNLDKARVITAGKKYEKALEQLEAAFKLGINDAGSLPYRVLAEVLEGLHREDELIGRLVKLYALDTNNHALGYYLAGRYMAAESFDKAEPLYKALLKRSPTLIGYRSLSEIYRKNDRTEDLLEVIGSVVDKTGILESLGDQLDAIRDDDKLMDELLALAEKQRQADPKQLGDGLPAAVALLALEHEQFDTAAKFFNLAMKADSSQSAELLLIWGVGLLISDKADEAAKVFQRGIDEKALPQDNPAFWFYLAGALELDGRTEDALAAARKAAHLKEELPRFAIREAWVLDHAKRRDEAIAVYTRVIEKFDADHKSTETREVLRDARLALSALCVNADRNAEAEEWLQQILDEFPDDIGAMNDLGYLWADQNKRLLRAERMIRKAVEAHPEKSAYLDSLGWVLHRLGKNNQAITELKKAINADKSDSEEPDAVILEHLGDAYSAAGKRAKAKQTWQRALRTLLKLEENEKADKLQEKIKRKTK